jgi:hypothetical protein
VVVKPFMPVFKKTGQLRMAPEARAADKQEN